MDVSVNLPPELQQATLELVNKAMNQAIKVITTKNNLPAYMTQQEASKYLHIAPSTFTSGNGSITSPLLRLKVLNGTNAAHWMNS